MNSSWKKHYQKIQEKKLSASATLVKAIALFDKEKVDLPMACDLGCGTGIDTIALIEKGWEVIAIDNQKQAIEELRNGIPVEYSSKLILIKADFEVITLPNVLLVNACFSLPFCHPENFNVLWQKIIQSILPNGRFAGHFFGVNDSWASDPEKTFHSKEQILNLFAGFELEYFEEVEKAGKSIDGKEKNWHVFHIVSKKIS
ncbi:class I SAM-dependent methyltransferase [Flavobacterium psychroterrae]|uniref:Class I SAM-dependent methyltransferase n=1 Tax=Flavobacterium psychroterrae TaxID=2133767 RepID=A0ABS5PDS0_9FLAO|nr:class I SAM-dependent methyltransferase [Flavobacterium psychroterrae]MBS7232427.1 class I SAM-dependent methyltransferase [Flavobacterium psychroterrae]